GVGSLDVVLEPCGRGLEHVDRVELPEERQVVRDGVGHARTVREVRGAGLPRAAPAAQPGTWGWTTAPPAPAPMTASTTTGSRCGPAVRAVAARARGRGQPRGRRRLPP